MFNIIIIDTLAHPFTEWQAGAVYGNKTVSELTGLTGDRGGGVSLPNLWTYSFTYLLPT